MWGAQWQGQSTPSRWKAPGSFRAPAERALRAGPPLVSCPRQGGMNPCVCHAAHRPPVHTKCPGQASQRQETGQRVTQASMVGRPRRAGHPGLLCDEYTLEEAGGKPGQAPLGCHCPNSLSANRNQWFPEASFFRGLLKIIVPGCVSKCRPASAGFWVVSWVHPWGPCGSGDRLPPPSQSSPAQQWCPLHALPSIPQTMLCW